MGRKGTTVRRDVKPTQSVRLSKINKVHAKNDKVLIDRVKPDLRRWHKSRDIKSIYIGQTSASTGNVSAANKAMKTRIDKRKHEMGTTEMKLLDITKSSRYADNAERELIAYNKKQSKKAANQRGGGGGAPTDQPHHVVYAALTKKGKGKGKS